MANQVKLTFAGETKDIEQSFDRVGKSSKSMGADLEESTNGFHKVGEAADNSERNIIGVHDVIDGTATIMQGPGKQGIVAYIQGWADLAGGAAPLILTLAETKFATIAQTVASKAAAVGTKIWAGAQWLMNTALLASPITWIIVGIVALIAVIVLIATKTTWFQTIWRNVWRGVTAAASASWDFIRKIPGWIGSAFSRVAGFITAPYRAAFNGIARMWNNTVGRLSFTVPGWIPGIGGNSFSVPRLPTFHSGVGRVPGPVGQNVVAMLQGGEEVRSVASSSGAGGVVYVQGDGIVGALVDAIAAEVRARGGRPEHIGLKAA
jgi:phage-related protein